VTILARQSQTAALASARSRQETLAKPVNTKDLKSSLYRWLNKAT